MGERKTNVDMMRIIATIMVAVLYITNSYCYSFWSLSGAEYSSCQCSICSFHAAPLLAFGIAVASFCFTALLKKAPGGKWVS